MISREPEIARDVSVWLSAALAHTVLADMIIFYDMISKMSLVSPLVSIIIADNLLPNT